MERNSFADGIGAVTVIGSTVRLDYVVYEPERKDGKSAPTPVFQHRIIMSLEGFMQSVEKLNETAKALSQMSHQARQTASRDAAQDGATAPAEKTDTSKPKRPFP